MKHEKNTLTKLSKQFSIIYSVLPEMIMKSDSVKNDCVIL